MSTVIAAANHTVQPRPARSTGATAPRGSAELWRGSRGGTMGGRAGGGAGGRKLLIAGTHRYARGGHALGVA
eukprot:10608322-Alexandrium_andersonii.AAC.1